MIPHDTPLQIGSLLFDGIDQIDLTGPFEVLSRIPNATYRIYGKTTAPVRDLRGLLLTPDAVLAHAPPLDVLHVPGGHGQEALMDDAEVLNWIRQQASGACSIFSVCTGALICGAAGLLKGRRATTHWASLHLLPYFGAIPVNERVVFDGAWIFAAGVTAGIDGALRLAAELRGDEVAQTIQLQMAYAPEPPFDSGTPESASPEIVEQARRSMRTIAVQREQTARRVAAKLGISVQAALESHLARADPPLGGNRGLIGASAKESRPKIGHSSKRRVTHMTNFPLHTLETAPERSKPALQQLQSAFGMIPNIAGAMATSPVLINTLVGMFANVHGGSFSEAQVQIVLLTDAVTNRSAWAVAFHTALALKEGIGAADVEAIRDGRLPSDGKSAALSGLAKTMIEKRGCLDHEDVTRFLAAGFGKDHLLEVIAAVAASTITNYTGNITKPPLEAPFQNHAWGG